MDKQQLEQFRQTMTARREQLREDILAHLNSIGDSSMSELYGMVHDAGEESIADMLADMRFTSLEQESQEVAALEAALMRIRNGSYGRCLECDEEIELERLQANPAAERCYDCQARKENDQSGRDRTPSL